MTLDEAVKNYKNYHAFGGWYKDHIFSDCPIEVSLETYATSVLILADAYVQLTEKGEQKNDTTQGEKHMTSEHVLEFTVEGRRQLCAAIKAAAQPSTHLALANPVVINLVGTNTRYTFKEGIREQRVRPLLRRIKRTPLRYFR